MIIQCFFFLHNDSCVKFLGRIRLINIPRFRAPKSIANRRRLYAENVRPLADYGKNFNAARTTTHAPAIAAKTTTAVVRTTTPLPAVELPSTSQAAENRYPTTTTTAEAVDDEDTTPYVTEIPPSTEPSLRDTNTGTSGWTIKSSCRSSE